MNSWEQPAVHWEWVDRLSLNNQGQLKLVTEAKMKKRVWMCVLFRSHVLPMPEPKLEGFHLLLVIVLCLILCSKRVREISLEVEAEQRSLFKHLKHQTFTKRLPLPSSVSQSPFLHTWLTFLYDSFDCNTLHNISFYFLWPSFFCLQHSSKSSGYLNDFKRLEKYHLWTPFWYGFDTVVVPNGQ